MFEKPDKSFRKAFCIYGLLISGMYSMHFYLGVTVLSLFIFSYLFIIRREYVIMYWIISFPFVNAVSSTLSVTCLIITCAAYLISLLFEQKGIIELKSLLVFLIISVVCVISYFVGISTDIISMFLFELVVLMMFFVKSTVRKGKFDYVLYSFDICSLCIIISILIGAFFDRNSVFTRGRLSFSDNVKTLAEFIVIPLFFRIISALDKKSLYSISNAENRKNMVAIIMLTLLLISTISRGTIVAILGALLLYSLLNYRNSRNLIFLISVLLAGTLALTFFEEKLTNLGFLSHIEGFNGRTDIWRFYIDLYKSYGFKNIIFGLGPGNIQRLASGTRYGRYYIHSVIVDCLVTYGLLGMSILGISFLSFIRKSIKRYNSLALSLVVLCLLMFFTHGNINYRLFYIMIGIIAGLLDISRKEEMDC